MGLLVFAGPLSGSMGLPGKYPPISSPRIHLGRSSDFFVRLLWSDFLDPGQPFGSSVLLAPG